MYTLVTRSELIKGKGHTHSHASHAHPHPSLPNVHMHTSPCRHILFTPQSYHVASTESFSFTSYSTERFEVTATLSYDQCSCTNRRRSCNNNGNVLSSAAGTTRFGGSDCHVIAAHSCSNLYFAVHSVEAIC